MKYLIIFLLIFSALITKADANDITAERAIEMVKQMACDYDYDLTPLNYEVLRNETIDNFYGLGQVRKSRKDIEVDAHVKNKEFWAVHFYHKQYMHDGTIVVYIDAANGQIIDYYPESPEEFFGWRENMDKEITIDAAIEIADSELKKIGRSPQNMSVVIKNNDIRGVEFYPENNIVIRHGIEEIKTALDNKPFWLVYYHTKGSLEKEACFFIDKKTGNIMLSLSDEKEH